MVYTNDQIFVNAYNAMKHHLASQTGSKLKGLFSEEIARGEKHFFDRIGQFSVSELNTLAAPHNYLDAQMSRRMATIGIFNNATLIHDIEKLKMISDPTSDIVTEVVGAHNRNYDDVLFAAMLGVAATGKDGAGTAAFDTANQQIAHGGTGLTLDKLLQAQRILEEGDVDLDARDVYLILSPRAKEDLLAISNFTSRDFQPEPTLGGKMLPSFRGMKLVVSNRIPDQTAGSVRRALLVTSNALKVAKYHDNKIDISQNKNLQNLPYQIYAESSVGAVRMEEKLIVDILFQ